LALPLETLLTEDPAAAGEFLCRGGIVAFPTETVYGLGANVFEEGSIARVFEAKRRPSDNPLIAHIGRIEHLEQLASQIPLFAQRLIEAFFPGPLTLVLPKRDEVPLIATAGLNSIGVRMPGHDLAREFLTACGTPVVAPSANLSGRPSPTTWEAVYEDLNGRIDCILKGEPTEIGLESTVVDCTGDRPVILRQGSVTLEDIGLVVPEAIADDSEKLHRKSPGLRHKHYSPNASVVLVDRETKIEQASSSAYIGLSDRDEPFASEKIVGDLSEYAHALFEFFRECEREGIETIYCEAVEEAGVGGALMDRIRRAAHG
jgi:L-threonylcarbamoyladenylate synthase